MASVVTEAVFFQQLHFPPRSIFGGIYAGGQNSVVGKAIFLNIAQGSSSSGDTHSLSGTQYSVAFIRYCAGRTIRTTENIPRDTVR